MERFDHYIREARPIIMDSEGFWKPHAWLRADLEELRDSVADGIARLIYKKADSVAYITFGRGFHYEVEYVERCGECGVKLFHDEVHPDTGTCYDCAGAALDQLAVGL